MSTDFYLTQVCMGPPYVVYSISPYKPFDNLETAKIADDNIQDKIMCIQVILSFWMPIQVAVFVVRKSVFCKCVCTCVCTWYATAPAPDTQPHF